jgi:hypothetical protein
MSSESYYRIIRGQIEHEDGLISQRISWFVTAQSFLFTAYAIVTSNLHAGTDKKEDQMRLLLLLIPISAMLTSLLIYATIIAGFIAIVDLRNPTTPPRPGFPRCKATAAPRCWGKPPPCSSPSFSW